MGTRLRNIINTGILQILPLTKVIATLLVIFVTWYEKLEIMYISDLTNVLNFEVCLNNNVSIKLLLQL